MAHDVFISYSHKNAVIADAVCHRFEEKGIRCWYAPRNIRPGDNWATSIIRALSDAKLMVLIFTGDSNVSVQVHREVDAALSSGVPIIPFRCSADEPVESMRYYLAGLHWIDAIEGELEDSIGRLLEQTKRLLSVSASGIGTSDGGTAVPVASRRKKTIFALVAGFLALCFVFGALWLAGVFEPKAPALAEPPAGETAGQTAGQTVGQTLEIETSEEPDPYTMQQGEPLYSDDYQYSIGAYSTVYEKCVRLEQYLGESTDVLTVPETIDGLPVTCIGKDCFEGIENIQSVVLPETIENVGRCAFYGCNMLCSINFPASLTSIEYWAFGRTGFKEITIPNTVKKLGDGVFCSCDKLASAVISENVTKIGYETFCADDSLISVTFLGYIESIGADAFARSRQAIIIAPDGCFAQVYANAMKMSFQELSEFSGEKKELVPYTAEFFYTIGDYSELYEKSVRLELYFGGETAELPAYIDGLPVTAVYEECFSGNETLRRAVLPDTLETIGTAAFYQCSNLTEINLPSSIKSIGSSAFAQCGFVNVVIPDSVTELSNGVFFGCSNLETVVVSKNVTVINEGTFRCDEKLREITFRGEMTDIHVDALRDSEQAVIIGLPGSYAETYAKAKKMEFREYSD